MSARKLFIAVFLFCSGATAAIAQNDDVKLFWEFSSGNWAGGAYKTADGAFSHCYTAAAYQSGVTMAIGITADYDLQLALGHSDWNLPVGDVYNVGLSIDGRSAGQFPAVVTDVFFLTIYVGNRNDILSRLRHGYELRVDAAQKSFYFSLAGTNRALKQVQDCVDLAVALSPSRQNPFASDGSQASPFAHNATADSSLQEERELVKMLLMASGLSAVSFSTRAWPI